MEQVMSPAKCETFCRAYGRKVVALLERLDVAVVARAAAAFRAARAAGATVFCVGNGGSAATASHLAHDLSHNTQVDGVSPLRAISLAANASTLTALANDAGFDRVFAEQVRTLARSGDVVVGISASGNSPNVVAAFGAARELGVLSIGLVGFDGGRLLTMSDIAIHVATAPGEYGPVEDAHMVVCHMLTLFLKSTATAATTGLGSR